jgi:hypothetical protein
MTCTTASAPCIKLARSRFLPTFYQSLLEQQRHR